MAVSALKMWLDSRNGWLDVQTFRFTILTILGMASIALVHDGTSNAVSAAPQTQTPSKIQMHHLRFPNTAVGWVYYRPPGASQELHVKAAGDVAVPAGMAVTLTLSGAATDMGLGFLTNVSPLQVRGLNFSDLDIGDRDIKYLKHFSGIRKLQLGGTNFTDKGLGQLVSKYPDVEIAVLARTPITAKSIPVIAKGWKSLFKLVLSGVKLGPNSIDPLKDLKELRHLDLDMADLADIDMNAAGQLVNLVELDLSGNPKITDKGVARLTNLKVLSRLDLADTSITGASAAYLKVLPKLKKLRIRAAQLTASDIARLKKAVKGRVEDPGDKVDLKIFEPLHDGYLNRH